ncbi:MAG: response regulator, partial [Leptospiraceae bacterium]|nr:response regulator [Leptospiraceae bacterium]
KKEIEGKNPNFLSARLFDKSHYEELWNTILSGKIWHGEFYNRKKNGDLYWELASITSIKNSKGEVVNFIAVKEDITERKRIEKELKEAKEQADYANKAKSEFLAMMSHEIRTPLNGIIGMSKLLNDLKLNDEQREYIQAINISSESLLTVINDILDYSKIESGKLEFEYKPFSPVSCILDSIKIFTLRAREKGILLEYEILNNIPQYVAGDVIRTRQILINLIGNAIKFTNEGQIKVNISSKEMHNENVEITYTVKDTGIGISKNNLEKLFQSFSQADSSISRKYGGTGLGLAISKRLSELMGGKIWVNSVLGEGSEFSFSIIAGKTTYIKPIETPQDFFDKQQIPEIKILLAEDNEINRLLALRILQKAKLNADVALNGEDAIRLFKEKEYDLILMDIQMPEMDGIEATSHIRNLSQSNDKPVIIAMTANAMTGDKEQYLLSGMNDYISKPIQKEELLEKIKRIQFSS